MNAENLTLIDAEGKPIAQLQANGGADDWFTGKLVSQEFTAQLQEALAWYDEVVENQMLSYLDQATAAVDHFGLRIRSANGAARRVFSLHIDKHNEVSFRTSPVPPPAWLTKSESA